MKAISIMPTLIIECNNNSCMPCKKLAYYPGDLSSRTMRQWHCTLFDNAELANDENGHPLRLPECIKAEEYINAPIK